MSERLNIIKIVLVHVASAYFEDASINIKSIKHNKKILNIIWMNSCIYLYVFVQFVLKHKLNGIFKFNINNNQAMQNV